MIIGNNFNKDTNKFKDKMKNIKDNASNMTNDYNPFVEDVNSYKYSDASNTNNMYDKSLAMLHERLKNGTITLEEFNKECEKLAKLRKKSKE